jgi:hypothetical protein
MRLCGRGWRRGLVGGCVLWLSLLGGLREVRAQGAVESRGLPERRFVLEPRTVLEPRALVGAMIGRERAAAEHRDRYVYLSRERSARTGERLWTEKVVETPVGKVRMLVAEDGAPLSAERMGAERSRLGGIVADPAGFAKREQALKNDENHAKEMLELLPRAFLFENARVEGEFERIDYRPNPAYQPQGLEERVLHGMAGSMVVDTKAVRLRRLDGHLGEDVSIGFGLLATIKAGSRFAIERAPVDGSEWKTTLIDLDVNGKAIFFKAISKNEHAEHGEFRRVPDDITVAQAVATVER